jgi:hypothetical protein
MALRALYRYLDKAEAISLKQKLEAEKIFAEIRPQGLPRYLGGFMNNFQVRIDGADEAAAQKVLEAFVAENAQKRAQTNALLEHQCPQCQSAAVVIKEKKSLFDKIRYYGVQVRNCRDCGCKWYL